MKKEWDIKKNGIISGIVVALILAVSLYFIIDNATKTATIKITVAPQSAEILINGRRYKNGEHRVRPGEYEMTIQKEDFAPVDETFALKDGETKMVYLIMEQTDGTYSWYEEHPEDMALFDPIKDYQMQQNAEKLKQKFPLISTLPIKVERFLNYTKHIKYEISYRIDDADSVTIVINDETGGNYEAALNNIRSRGFEPKDYKIEYNDESGSLEWGHAS